MRPRLSVGEKLTIATLVLAGVVWAVRLEGRVATVEKTTEQAIQQFRDDLRYIRDRIDRALVGPR